MIMTGVLIPADEAYRIGLVSQVTEDADTIPTAIKMAENLAAMPPIALQQIKEVALHSEDVPLNAGLTLERKSFQLLFQHKINLKVFSPLWKNVNPFIRANNF